MPLAMLHYLRAIWAAPIIATDGSSNRYKSSQHLLMEWWGRSRFEQYYSDGRSGHENPRKNEHLRAFWFLAAEAAKRNVEERMAEAVHVDLMASKSRLRFPEIHVLPLLKLMRKQKAMGERHRHTFTRNYQQLP